MLNIGQTNTYAIGEYEDSTQAVALLTSSSGTFADVPSALVTTISAAQGDTCLIHGSFALSADSGSVCEAVLTVDDNGTVSDLAITTRRTDNTAPGLLFNYAFVAKYVIAHAPTSGPPGTTTFKYRARRQAGGGNAYFRSPAQMIVQLSRGL